MGFQAGQRALAAQIKALIPQVLDVPANVPINSTSALPVVSGTVAAAKYEVSGVLECVIGGTNTAPSFRFDLSGGAVVSSMLVPYAMWTESNSGEQVFAGHLTGTGSGNFSSITAAFGSGTDVQIKFDGIINFSTGGTLTLSAAETTTAQPFTISLDSYMKLTQQVT